MYNVYKHKQPTTLVSCSSYFKYFKQDFIYKFDETQVDCCCVCYRLIVNIDSLHLNDRAKIFLYPM
jgi:hypothetical protein